MYSIEVSGTKTYVSRKTGESYVGPRVVHASRFRGAHRGKDCPKCHSKGVGRRHCDGASK